MESTEIAYIYALLDPITLDVRYIGKTINPKGRLKGHINETKYYDHYRSRWIRSLLKDNLEPIIKILKICPLSDFVKYESEFIKKYKSDKLTNSDETGQGNVGRRKDIIDNASKKISKIVYQYDLDGNYINEYKSVREAGRVLNIYHSYISRCCNGEYKHTNEFIFSYIKLDKVNKILNPNAVKKSIIEVDLNDLIIGTWNSLMECCRDTGIDNGNLSRVCNGKLPHIKGRYFKFK